MQKKLTITLDERVYEGLHQVIGRRRISGFIESLVRPHVVDKSLHEAYRQMARDDAREAEAFEWAEALIGDAVDWSAVKSGGSGSIRRLAAKCGNNAQPSL